MDDKDFSALMQGVKEMSTHMRGETAGRYCHEQSPKLVSPLASAATGEGKRLDSAGVRAAGKFRSAGCSLEADDSCFLGVSAFQMPFWLNLRRRR